MHATTIVPPEFPTLVNESDYIVRAVVTAVSSVQKTMPSGRVMPYTRIELETKQVIAGKPPVPLVLEMLGGRSPNGRELAISGAPKFEVGEESILFVQGNGKQVYPLVRMAHGLYPIVKEADSGKERIVRSDGTPLRKVSEVSGEIHTPGGRVAQAAEALQQALTPDEFVQSIRASITKPELRE